MRTFDAFFLFLFFLDKMPEADKGSYSLHASQTLSDSFPFVDFQAQKLLIFFQSFSKRISMATSTLTAKSTYCVFMLLCRCASPCFATLFACRTSWDQAHSGHLRLACLVQWAELKSAGLLLIDLISCWINQIHVDFFLFLSPCGEFVPCFFLLSCIHFLLFFFSLQSNGLPALCDLTLSANQGNGVVTLRVEELVGNNIHFLWGKVYKNWF